MPLNYKKKNTQGTTKKALWTTMPNSNTSQPKKPKWLKPVSDKRRKESKAYRNLRTLFLSKYPTCCACYLKKSTDVHHKRGRAGNLYLDMKFWMAVCRDCHDFIRDNPMIARKYGWLCQIGEWGKQD